VLEHGEVRLPLGGTKRYHRQYTLAGPQPVSFLGWVRHSPALAPKSSSLFASALLSNADVEPHDETLQAQKDEARQRCEQPVGHRGLEEMIVLWRHQPNEQLQVNQNQNCDD
jgi:hypothetical protein